jgi:hypothetical protein
LSGMVPEVGKEPDHPVKRSDAGYPGEGVPGRTHTFLAAPLRRWVGVCCASTSRGFESPENPVEVFEDRCLGFSGRCRICDKRLDLIHGNGAVA